MLMNLLKRQFGLLFRLLHLKRTRKALFVLNLLAVFGANPVFLTPWKPVSPIKISLNKFW